jgi:hypothetical protein
MSKLTKDRDHAPAMIKVFKKEKIEFDIGHARLREEQRSSDK